SASRWSRRSAISSSSADLRAFATSASAPSRRCLSSGGRTEASTGLPSIVATAAASAFGFAAVPSHGGTGVVFVAEHGISGACAAAGPARKRNVQTILRALFMPRSYPRGGSGRHLLLQRRDRARASRRLVHVHDGAAETHVARGGLHRARRLVE